MSTITMVTGLESIRLGGVRFSPQLTDTLRSIIYLLFYNSLGIFCPFPLLLVSFTCPWVFASTGIKQEGNQTHKDNHTNTTRTIRTIRRGYDTYVPTPTIRTTITNIPTPRMPCITTRVTFVLWSLSRSAHLRGISGPLILTSPPVFSRGRFFKDFNGGFFPLNTKTLKGYTTPLIGTYKGSLRPSVGISVVQRY